MASDTIPAYLLPACCLYFHYKFALSGPGGLLATGLPEAIRASSDAAASHVIGKSADSPDPEVLSASRGIFQIPSEIRSDRFCVQSMKNICLIYVCLLVGTGDNLDHVSTPCISYIEPLHREMGGSHNLRTKTQCRGI